jgi:CheY-like chemotaxis protein
LGLAIVSQLVHLMGGRIWVESETGCGSTFHFVLTFPRSAAAPAVVPAESPRFVEGARVLIVDDNTTNQRILVEMTRNWRMQPTAASSAREALDAWHQAYHQGAPFPLMITDMNMPDVDGLTLSEWIRDEAQSWQTAIIVLTSGLRPADADRCVRLNVAARLMKPARQSELFNAIAAALGGVPAAIEAGTADASPGIALPPLRVLLAEDSVVNQQLAMALLQKHGHQVTVAGDGKAAVEAVADGEFDLILMDVEMPELDGLGATREIRRRERDPGAHLPIIAMTAHAMKGDRERCLQAGMDDYVAKPIRAAEMFRKIAEVLARLQPDHYPAQRRPDES